MDKKELKKRILEECFVTNQCVLVDDMVEFVIEREDRAREEGINEALKEMNGTLNTNCSFNYNISTCCQLNSYFYYFLCYI